MHLTVANIYATYSHTLRDRSQGYFESSHFRSLIPVLTYLSPSRSVHKHPSIDPKLKIYAQKHDKVTIEQDIEKKMRSSINHVRSPSGSHFQSLTLTFIDDLDLPSNILKILQLWAIHPILFMRFDLQ